MAPFARRKPQPTRSVTAAARSIPLGTRTGTGAGSRAARVTKPAQWQNDAWDAYDQVGHVKATFNFIAACLSRLDLFPAVQINEDEEPVHVDTAAARAEDTPEEWLADPPITADLADAITEELARIHNPLGGQAEIMRLFGLCLGIPGECYLVGRTIRPSERATVDPRQAITPTADDDGDGPEEWDVFAPNEIREDPNAPLPEGASLDWKQLVIVEDENQPLDKAIRLTPDDIVVRVWRRHPRWKNQPDSHMRAALTETDEILAMSRAFQATMSSRTHAGIMTFPVELDQKATNEHGERAAGEGDDRRPSERIVDSLIAPAADPSNASAVTPHMIVGDSKYLGPDVLRWIDIAREWPQIASDERKAANVRLAQALPVPPEQVLGFGDTNHWSAWFIGDETYEGYIKPEATLIVDAVMEGVIRPALRARGTFDEESVMAARIGIDATGLVVNPNELKDKQALHGALVLSDAALRRAARVPESDAPDEEELLRRTALERGTFTPEATFKLLQTLMEAMAGVTLPAPSTSEAQPVNEAGDEDENRQGPPPMAIAAAGTPASGLGARLADIDRSLRDRLAATLDRAMRAVLARAGAKLRSKGQGDEAVTAAAKGQPNERLAALLGPSIVAALGVSPNDLVPEDAFDGERETWDAWVARAQSEALAAVSESGGLSESERAEVERAQAEDRDAGWLLLAAALVGLARARLFNPDATVDDVGEGDVSVTVPAGVVREALARAGGETHVGNTPGSPGVDVGGGLGLSRRLLDATGQPAGGVATGARLRSALASAGLLVSGFRWRYGDPSTRTRQFQPHRALNGIVFAQWDETVLRVGSEAGWVPAGFYFPGDHRGCDCSYELVVATSLPSAP